jgi:exodeoxyribonuclease VII large subunit
VTALGHTSDRTIADMVADAECRTPTEAGARVVPRKSQLVEQLRERGRRLDRELQMRLDREANAVAVRSTRLSQVLPTLVRRREERLESFRRQLAQLSPVQQVERRAEGIRDRQGRLGRAVSRALRTREAQLQARPPERLERLLRERIARLHAALDQRTRRLEALSPELVLARGYSITTDAASRHVLRDANDTEAGREIVVTLARGELAAQVETVR